MGLEKNFEYYNHIKTEQPLPIEQQTSPWDILTEEYFSVETTDKMRTQEKFDNRDEYHLKEIEKARQEIFEVFDKKTLEEDGS